MPAALNAKIGFFLAIRQIRRASLWTTGLIIFVMVLTFLNLVVVSGVLVGLIEGSIAAWHSQYTSDIIVSAPESKSYIENSQNILNVITALPEVQSVSPRFTGGVSMEANYQTRKDTEKPNVASAELYGIDPSSEDQVTGLASRLIAGSYLLPGDYDQVLIGYFLLKKYVLIDSPGFAALDNVDVGTKIRITTNGITHEVTVKGILKSKVDNVRRGLYMVAPEAKQLIGRDDGNVAEIAVKLKPGVDPLVVKQKLIWAGVDKTTKVQTYADAQPQFLKDVVATFATLGNVFSSIGLVVASITIFIVVFINAITRRKFIGILKGIGINSRVIEFSYIMQSVFYAFCGSAIGLVIVYVLLVPYFTAHPIDFPFSDGILVAPYGETFLRVALLVFSNIIAGYIPARMIVRKNTLDSILGRN